MTAAEHSYSAPWRRELAGAGLQAMQQERAVLAAEEAELVLEPAGLCSNTWTPSWRCGSTPPSSIRRSTCRWPGWAGAPANC